MAFDKAYIRNNSGGSNDSVQGVWSYDGTAAGSNEAVATIAASGYFNSFQQNRTAGFLSGPLKVGDVIMIHGNDANGMYVVTSITTNVTVGAFASAGTIDTANLADDAVTSAKIDEQVIQHTSVSITLAEFVGSYTTSHEVVAAPGAGKKIILHRAVLGVDYGGTVLANGGNVALQYNNTANQGGVLATGVQSAATLIAATADTTLGFSPVDTTLVDANTLNEGLYLATATADFTGGDTSTYEMDIWYSVMDLS